MRERRVRSPVFQGVQDRDFAQVRCQYKSAGSLMAYSIKAVIIIPADGRYFPSFIQRGDEWRVMDIFVRIDHLQQRDDVPDFGVGPRPVIILLRAGMIEARHDRAIAIGWKGLKPPV